MDAVQGALDVAGLAPGAGMLADLANAGISVARGNYGDAALSMAAAIPIVGTAAGATKLVKGVTKLARKSADDFTYGYRAVSRAEAKDIAKHGFRPDPSGRSMQDKWFSETRKGAEKFKGNYSDLDEVVKAKVPRDVYNRSYKHPNIDDTGPGFCVSCGDLSRLKVVR